MLEFPSDGGYPASVRMAERCRPFRSSSFVETSTRLVPVTNHIDLPDPEVAVMRVEHIRPYNIDLMSAEKVGNP
jgi:hypothetical protein